ncbi:hypothetical protein M404DRAFT_618836 [Pisolithus tinctorius Marx 270]|uniref:Uncharacterized protein n=1 Tax=Pisolithus tinctorius Marx 270 TaxID=870435 RepID=A0A0C3P739_PISTI|nr:hypothetical protein M404DRAFT_618836 [Pisolithus tinctorius Marx 270]
MTCGHPRSNAMDRQRGRKASRVSRAGVCARLLVGFGQETLEGGCRMRREWFIAVRAQSRGVFSVPDINFEGLN